MAYKHDPIKNFRDYQVSEGFPQATGAGAQAQKNIGLGNYTASQASSAAQHGINLNGAGLGGASLNGASLNGNSLNGYHGDLQAKEAFNTAKSIVGLNGANGMGSYSVMDAATAAQHGTNLGDVSAMNASQAAQHSVLNGFEGDMSALKASQAAKSAAPVQLNGLKGYEGYPQSYGEIQSQLQGGSFGEHNGDAFAGFEGFEETDAMQRSNLVSRARDWANKQDTDYGLGSYNFSGQSTESYITYFNLAKQASSQEEMIKHLSKGVMAVGLDTPMALRQRYFDMTKDMLLKRQREGLRIDIGTVELESNIGHLINPHGTAKQGGLNKIVKDSVKLASSQFPDTGDYRLMRAKVSGVKRRMGLGDFQGNSAMCACLGALAVIGLVAWSRRSKSQDFGL